ncbi:MAG: heme exporter protein CcmB, partial [Pseudomonadota bacterium]
MPIFRGYQAVVARELRKFARHRNEVTQPLIFFLLVVSLFSIAVGGDERLIKQIAPATAWVAVVLAITLKLESIFSTDYADGSLEQLRLSTTPLTILVAAKLVAHWLCLTLPQVISAAAVLLIIGIPPGVCLALTGSLLLGTPALVAVGAIAASLSLGSRTGGTLIA